MVVIEVNSEIELKQIELSDSKDIFNAIDSQREYLGKWLPFVAVTKEISDTDKFIEFIINAPEDKREYVFVIRKHNRFIGMVGFKDTDKENQKTEIAYWLSKEYQKQGIITKSVDKLCYFAFNELGINRIQIKCAVENKSSGKIPRRLDFKLEGVERQGELLTGNVFTDIEIYSKLKSEMEKSSN
ncbi:GNAT family N-acetyltransferase [Tenacibaculum agarivorans]|uniref:GNAT family N-acetyltransferase n=1 Tax=Tenacibaculum agarivorans TaxID=1908389 RepID=UPI00094B9C37|nr:GNAT family protein [Tenacibaculum agarivorans]